MRRRWRDMAEIIEEGRGWHACSSSASLRDNVGRKPSIAFTRTLWSPSYYLCNGAATTATATATATTTAESDKGLFGQLLVPGSSLHPTFLLILDGAFGLLLCVFLGLLFLTGGNGHLFALIGLEGCLWASVKWVVHELKNAPPFPGNETEDTRKKEE